MTQIRAPRWTLVQLAEDVGAAILHFREIRLQEPLEQYLDQFGEYRDVIDKLMEGTADLNKLSERAVELLTQPEMLTAIRYLAAPAISEDDLKVLSDAYLSPSRLRADPEMAGRIVDTVILGLDRNRFPWVGEGRQPTASEREVAAVSTAALIATQKVQTARRNDAKDAQEQAVASSLTSHGFKQVQRRPVDNVSHLPAPGEFYRESQFGSRKADLIVRLWDGRTMPVECKVSNSSTNSVKRLNNDAAVKAKTWIQEFGTSNTVPVAVLSGVFKVHNLESAQADGLTIFWAHRLSAMIEFAEGTRE